ncbi:MAG: hypothetical protein LBL58_12325 [Tannerellaceae bacterium]|jgi:hypothetical protein|nr:hypothetical protein [Tannerellaceae bacterium]
MKQMLRYSFLLIFPVNIFLCVYAQSAGITYSTNRLKEMAEQLDLSGIERLSPGAYHSYTFQSHPVTVRVNQWQEVEHIGFWLFTNDNIRWQNPSPVYDFLERYFLELRLPSGSNPVVRLFVDKVYISGDIDVIFSFDGTETFQESYIHSKLYEVSWTRMGKELLSVSFDMDYQLLSGCNILELENNLLRNIQRYEPDDKKVETSQPTDNFDTSDDYFTDRGDSYLIDLIRNDLYYVKEGDGYMLIHDSLKINQSIANMMLSPHVSGNFDLNLTFDKYGYKEEKIKIKLKQWIEYCLSEGCTAYFGIKSKDATSLKGTVFMVNKKRGYNHILSIDVPYRIIGKQEGGIDARLYAYIPMHNVSDKYFQ